jgi:hypothetical protein
MNEVRKTVKTSLLSEYAHGLPCSTVSNLLSEFLRGTAAAEFVCENPIDFSLFHFQYSQTPL